MSQGNDLSRSDLDWTVMPMLPNGAARGKYRVDGDALARNGTRISRADVADFMMQQIYNSQWIRRGVYISW